MAAPICIVGVTIGFEEEEYSANEGDADVEVCAVVQSGILERTVEVSLVTEDDTALGELLTVE